MQIRDLAVEPPQYGGRGRCPKRPWMRVDAWVEAASESDWTTVDVRDGSKGPLIVEVAKRSVVARTDKRQEGHPETLVVIRFRQRDTERIVQTDYYLSNATTDTRKLLAAKGGTSHRRMHPARQERGRLADRVRNWNGCIIIKYSLIAGS